MRGMTLDNLLLPRSSSLFALQVIQGSLVQLSHIFYPWELATKWISYRFARFWSLKSFENLRDRATFPWASSSYRYFSIFNQTSNNFGGTLYGKPQFGCESGLEILTWRLGKYFDTFPNWGRLIEVVNFVEKMTVYSLPKQEIRNCVWLYFTDACWTCVVVLEEGKGRLVASS